jgi:hypothetical protein
MTPASKRRKVTLNLDEDWLSLIDQSRGHIPRSRYVEMIARDIGLTAAMTAEADVEDNAAYEAHIAGSRASIRKHAPTCACAVCEAATAP